jgi:predicted ferric reductase
MSDDQSTPGEHTLIVDDANIPATDHSRIVKKDEIPLSSHRGSLPRQMALLRSGTLRLSETVLKDIHHLVEDSKYDDAIHKCFEAMDADQSGILERDELFVFLKEATAQLLLDVEDDVIHLAIDALMESIPATKGDNTAVVPAETETADIITRTQFFQMFQNNPDLYTVFESRESLIMKKKSSTLTLSIKDTPEQEKETEELWKHAKRGWKNYGIFVIWLALYIAATVSMFVSTAFRWANDDEALAVFGNCIIIARSCAAALNLHACLILLPISRHTLTLLRLSWARFLFPFDVSLEVHMLLGWVFGIFAATHILAHVCDYVRLVDADQADLEALLGHALPDIPESKSGRLKLMLKQPATITGIIMVLCLALAYPVVLSRRQHFNRFWYLHHLLIIMLIMMCVHGTGNLLQPFQSVYWICGPLALYIIPRIYREIKCRSVKVLGVNIHEGLVGLKVEKPPGWDRIQRAGMYAFINIPAISKWEWHPFTVSSSPFQPHLGFHIKVAGDWTTQLHRLMSEKKLAPENEDDSFYKVSETEQTTTAVYIEGPIGASSQCFSDHESVVLIGAGIGYVPMLLLNDL